MRLSRVSKEFTPLVFFYCMLGGLPSARRRAGGIGEARALVPSCGSSDRSQPTAQANGQAVGCLVPVVVKLRQQRTRCPVLPTRSRFHAYPTISLSHTNLGSYSIPWR